MNIFTKIYKENLWNSQESKSGIGSELQHTQVLIEELPKLLHKYNIGTILDIPCGDYNWMKEIDLDGTDISYIGADIVPELIQENKRKYHGSEAWSVLDIVNDPLPRMELVIVRDCLGHLSEDNARRAIRNIKKSGSKYLLATCCTKTTSNINIIEGGWHPINLMIFPYNMIPLCLINEQCHVNYPNHLDKCMVLFQLN